MILEDDELKERLESPQNLLNRLRRETEKQRSPSLPPVDSNDIIEDLDDKIQYGAVRSKAAAIMTSALDELKHRIPEVSKPEKLAQIAAEMNKVLISRQEQGKELPGQIVIYAPQLVDESNFNTIILNEK